MTKSDLIENVTKAVNSERLTKKLAEEVVEAAFTEIKNSLLNDSRFSYPGFGTFTVKERAARKGRNPRTGEPIDIPESRTVAFKPAPKFKDSL